MRAIENTPVSGSSPKETVTIKDCGVLEVTEEFNVED